MSQWKVSVLVSFCGVTTNITLVLPAEDEEHAKLLALQALRAMGHTEDFCHVTGVAQG